MELSGIPLRLEGVGEEMAERARQVLEKQLALSGDTAASAPLADDLAFFLRQTYLQAGYPEAEADWELAGGTVLLQVLEGPHRTVGAIDFPGVDAVQAVKLRPYLTRQTREREGRLAKSLPFVESDLTAGASLVVRRLQADGYLQAQAAPAVHAVNEATGAVDTTLPLTLGPLSVFGAITLAGDPVPLSREMREKAAALAGQPWSEVRVENMRKELKGDLQSQGWFAAEVDAVTVTSAAPPPGRRSAALATAAATVQAGPVPPVAVAGTLPATFIVRPGKIFTVAEVRTAATLGQGARRVTDAVFGATTGDVFDPETLDLLHRRSMDTGIFSRLDVEPVALSDDTLALTVTGEEAKPKTLGFFGGYETFYGPIAGVEARHVNFMDTGNALGLRAELRGTGVNGSLNWTDPAVFGSRNALGLGVALENFTFKDYTRNSLSLRASLTRRLNRHITAELFTGASFNAVESDVLTPLELGPDNYDVLSAGARLILDYRDNPLNPRSGWLAGASVEGGFDQGSGGGVDGEGRAGGGSVNFVRTDVNASWYHPLGPSWRLALGARASSISGPDGIGDLPIDLRLFNGGGTTVRSFAEREMGPDSARGSTPLGGVSSAVVNAELSWQVITNLELAAFADAGALDQEDASLFALDDLRYAIGLGIRYRLPIGPLRIDYGYNPDRRAGEKAGALHVTFGFAF